MENKKENEDEPLDSLLRKTRIDLLTLKTSEIKTLIKYYTYKGFSAVYKVDHELENELIQKFMNFNDNEGLTLMNKNNNQFKSELQIEVESKAKKAELELQQQLKAELELQMELQRQLEEQKQLEEQLNEAQNEAPEPIQKIEDIQFKDDNDSEFSESRRKKSSLNSLKDLQKPLRSMSRAASPKFDKSVSRRRIENPQYDKRERSPTGRDIFKQNMNNKITLSQYNGGEDRNLSLAGSRVDSTCNFSNLPPQNDTQFEEWPENKIIISKKRKINTRHSYNPEIGLGVSNPFKPFENKPFRNSSYGRVLKNENGNNINTTSLRNSSVNIRNSFHFDKFNEDKKFSATVQNNIELKEEVRDSIFSQLKSEKSNKGDKTEYSRFYDHNTDEKERRLERLRKKLEERRRIRNDNFIQKKSEIRSSMNINIQENNDELRTSKHLENRQRAQDIINKAKDIVKQANEKRRKIEETNSGNNYTDLTLDEKIKRAREKVKNQYENSKPPYFNKKARNTVNVIQNTQNLNFMNNDSYQIVKKSVRIRDS